MGRQTLEVARAVASVGRNNDARDLDKYAAELEKAGALRIEPTLKRVGKRGLAVFSTGLKLPQPSPLIASRKASNATAGLIRAEIADLERTQTRFRAALPPGVPASASQRIASGLGGVPVRSAQKIARDLDAKLRAFDEAEAVRQIQKQADKVRRVKAAALGEELATDVFNGVLLDAGEESGQIGGWIWFTADDEKVCDVCGAKEGQEVDEQEAPPAHAFCRCVIEPIAVKEGEEDDVPF